MIEEYCIDLQKKFDKMFDGLYINMSISASLNSNGIDLVCYSIFFRGGVVLTYGCLKITDPLLESTLVALAQDNIDYYNDCHLHESFDEIGKMKGKYEWATL
jgi:hypothetical protein